MDPGAGRCVRVIHDQGEAFGLGGHPAPFQGRGHVGGITSVFGGDRPALKKSSAGKLHVVLSGLISRKGTCHKGAECQTESSAREATAAGSCQVYGQASHRWQRRLGERLGAHLHSWTRTSVFTDRFPDAMDRNSMGNSVREHSPSTKSSERTTPASMYSRARRTVRGV